MTATDPREVEQREYADLASLGVVGTRSSPSEMPSELSHAFKSFEPIESKAVSRILAGLPWLILFVVLVRVTVFHAAPGVVMYLSSLVAVAPALLGFQLLMRLLKDLPSTLWERNLIAGRTGSPTQGPPVVEYAAFVNGFGQLMNGKKQIAFAFAFGCLGASWVAYAARTGEEFGTAGAIWEVVLAFGLGAFLGLLAWRMAITGYEIHRLGKDFDFRLQLGHPDQCGGLSPLGYFCLVAASVISVAGIHLGGWLILAPNLSRPYQLLARQYHDLYIGFLIVPLVLAFVSFFLPMWSVHEEMVAERERIQHLLDQIGRRIDELSRRVLQDADSLDPKTLEDMSKQLAAMHATYLENEHVPTWPFETRIFFKFVTSQTVPILGLTGVGAPMVKMVSSLLSFLDKGS